MEEMDMSSIQIVHGIGRGEKPRRILPINGIYLDPFLLLDHFLVVKPFGFPSHPHRGFEIITYVLEGALEHKDSEGNAGIIEKGALQRITAGRGIIHSEMPGTDGINSGLQLWINLPRAEKGMEPGYQDIKADEIPETEQNGVRIRTLVGEGSPVMIRRPMVYYDIAMEEDANYTARIPSDYQGFIYVLTGEGEFGEDQKLTEEGDLLMFAKSKENKTIPIYAKEKLHFVLAAGRPIGEQPIYNGPFVD
jgi:quercetin 2,3-dioxygenase